MCFHRLFWALNDFSGSKSSVKFKQCYFQLLLKYKYSKLLLWRVLHFGNKKSWRGVVFICLRFVTGVLNKWWFWYCAKTNIRIEAFFNISSISIHSILHDHVAVKILCSLLVQYNLMKSEKKDDRGLLSVRKETIIVWITCHFETNCYWFSRTYVTNLRT